MLTFIVKKEWFEKIERGEKTIEYREVKPYWTKRLKNPDLSDDFFFKEAKKIGAKGSLAFFWCRFYLGYTGKYLKGHVYRIAMIDGKNTDLKIDKPVYAIYFKLSKQGETK